MPFASKKYIKNVKLSIENVLEKLSLEEITMTPTHNVLDFYCITCYKINSHI